MQEKERKPVNRSYPCDPGCTCPKHSVPGGGWDRPRIPATIRISKLRDDPALTAWLAGLLEGEGTFTRGADGRPRIQLRMTDEDVIVRATDVIGAGSYNVRAGATSNHNDSYGFAIAGRHAVEVMKLIRPWMGGRRAARIDELTESA